MDISIFIDKTEVPDEEALKKALNETYSLWKQLRDYVFTQYPKAVQSWNFPGVKYGWSFRISDKKRVLVYLLPRDGYFKVALVFGQKAFEAVLESEVSDFIKAELTDAKAYAEGRGIRIDINKAEDLDDIFKLAEIKLKY